MYTGSVHIYFTFIFPHIIFSQLFMYKYDEDIADI